MKGGRLIGGRIEDGAETELGSQGRKELTAANYQAHADAGTKLHVDSMRFV